MLRKSLGDGMVCALRAMGLCAVLLCFGFAAVAQSLEDVLRREGWLVVDAGLDRLAKDPERRAAWIAARSRGYFEPAGAGALRHKPSQLVCPERLADWRLDGVRVTPPSDLAPVAGEDVQCFYRIADAKDAYVAVHLSPAPFPDAVQSLRFTVLGVQAILPIWMGWAVNMAPAADGAVAMTRGNVPQLGTDKIQASDIWIALPTTTTTRPGGVNSGWQIKIRPIGEAALRPSFDAASRAALKALANPAATPLGADSAAQSEFVVWADRANPETSALIHLESQVRCPSPSASAYRASLEFDGVRFACRYSSGVGALNTFRIDMSALSDPQTPDDKAESLAALIRETGAANKASVDAVTRSVLNGQAVSIVDWRVDTSLNRTIYLKHPRQNRTLSLSGFLTGAKERVAAEKLMAFAAYALGDDHAAPNPLAP